MTLNALICLASLALYAIGSGDASLDFLRLGCHVYIPAFA